MNYQTKSRTRLVEELRKRDFLIQELKKQYREDSGVVAFNKLALELEQERNARASYQELALTLQRELSRYRQLVGDELPPDEVADE